MTNSENRLGGTLPPSRRPNSEWAEDTRAVLARSSASWEEAELDDLVELRKIISELVRHLTNSVRLLGVPEAQLKPLQFLNSALFDLARGVWNPLFQLAAAGRPKNDALAVRRRVYGAALIRYFKQMKMMEVSAAQALIAREFTKEGHKAHNGGEITSDTVRRWHYHVFQGGESKPEQALAEDCIEKWTAILIKSEGPVPPRTIARSVARSLKKSSLTS